VTLRPIGKRVLVNPVEQAQEKTASGIVLPQTANEKPQTARVIRIGHLEDGRISEGEVVVFAKYSGTEINLENEGHLVLDSDDLLGVVEG
jgi:chaperonin GroES